MFKLQCRHRRQLDWHVFEQKQSGDWFLSLLPKYAELFEKLEPDLMRKAHSPWKESSSRKAMNLILSGLTDIDIERVERFIGDFKRHVVLGPSRHIEPYFTNEVDFCLALDFNFASVEEGRYTEIGKLEYVAKYQGSTAAGDEIAERMISAFHRIPAADKSLDCCLTYIPPSPNKEYYLPRYLAEKIMSHPDTVRRMRKEHPLVRAELRTKKPNIKEIRFMQKIKKCERIYSVENVSLSAPVLGCCVYVIDDLYKSGVSIWSFAKCLKDAGAESVMCLVCVKSRGDRDSS